MPRDLSGDEVPKFNSLTPENAMKIGPIHPYEHRYYWNDADSIVGFALYNGLKVRGRNLCWHAQAPAWLFKDSATGKTVTKEVLFQRLKDDIITVVNHYKGKIFTWDVVNEVIADNNTTYFRNSLWYQICGEDFVAKAFEYAHEADPKAVLFCNDYNMENPVKREKIYRMIIELREGKIPMQGISLQAHWSVNTPSAEELENSINMFS